MEHKILRTLAFFDLFDHPLSLYELYAWRVEGAWQSWSAFRAALDALEQAGRVRVVDGMVMLHDRAEILETRRARQQWIVKKMKRAMRAARLLRWVPFVEMAAVCNRLSVGHPHEDSDIDAFIIIRDGRLWFGRLLVTGVLQLASLRRHGSRIANRVCLSFYVTPRAAELDAIRLDDDWYLRYWISHLLPLYVRGTMMSDFWQANAWAHGSFHQVPMPMPFFSPRAPLVIRAVDWLFSEWIGNALERVARFVQQKRMGATEPKGTAVIISDTMLKFHEQDRRAFYATEWLARTNELGI